MIDTPSPSLTYAVGDPISFSGDATDPEDGALPDSALSWTLLIHHCTTPTTCHVHNVQTWSGVSSGGLSAPDDDYPSYLELVLQATDSGGLKSFDERDPRTEDRQPLIRDDSRRGWHSQSGAAATRRPSRAR